VVIGGWREIFPIILGKEGNVYEKWTLRYGEFESLFENIVVKAEMY
jgi:hypothetical protein